jgi:hypothetical protein
VEWVVREGVGAGGRICTLFICAYNQALYAHMNNKRKMKKKIPKQIKYYSFQNIFH